MKNMTMIYLILFIFYLMVYQKKIRFLRYKEKIELIKKLKADRSRKEKADA